MESNSHTPAVHHKDTHGNLTSYVIGFILSILLTLTSYLFVVEHILKGYALIFTISTLGIVQALAQLLLFLHLGIEEKPRWNFLIFLFMVMVLVIIVGGSLWIMDNLNYNTMSPMNRVKDLHHQE